MKQVIFGMLGTLVLALTLLVSITVLGKTARENELDNALCASVDEVMENLMETGDYRIGDEEELAADFCETLLQEITLGGDEIQDKNFHLQVDITGMDLKHGLLSVQVTESYTHPNGKIGKIKRSATAVYDQKKQRKQCVITYMANERLYKEYGLREGEDFVLPKSPKSDDEKKKFLYWKDMETGKRAEFPNKVSDSKQYIAVFQ